MHNDNNNNKSETCNDGVRWRGGPPPGRVWWLQLLHILANLMALSQMCYTKLYISWEISTNFNRFRPNNQWDRDRNIFRIFSLQQKFDYVVALSLSQKNVACPALTILQQKKWNLFVFQQARFLWLYKERKEEEWIRTGFHLTVRPEHNKRIGLT